MTETNRNKNIKLILMLLLCTLFIYIGVKCDLKIPDIMSEITMDLQQENTRIKRIVKYGGKMMLFTLGSISSILITSVIAARISSDFSAGLRHKLFCKTQEFSFKEINKFSIPSLITRTTNDIFNIENVIVMGIINVIKTPIVLCLALDKINGKHHEWTTITLLTILLIAVMATIGFLFAYRKYAALQELTDDVNLVSLENITGLYTIRANNFESKRYTRFTQKNTALAKTECFTNIVGAILTTMISFITNVLTVIIYYSGALMIKNAGFENKLIIFSDMIVYSTYALQIISAIVMLIIVLILIPRSVISFKRVYAVLKEKSSIAEGDMPQYKDISSIEFRNVSFRYPGAARDVLSGLNFDIHSGETLAIVGTTGCGKSTLLNLIMRFYDVSDGKLLINGDDIRNFSFEALHNMIGYVPQKASLFSGTIASNVSYGSDSENSHKVKTACRAAHVAEFAEALPDKYNSIVERGGNNFSGGQKQRITIARALYNTPPILIFDDSFSALDYKSDRTIRNNIKELCGNSIKIIVSQRISTILDADKIIVLENGTVSAVGTHEMLLKNCESYRLFAEIQNIGGDANE